ncbi:7-cyano-7-deazaguanine synthase [Bosea vestrisii]|uniref:Qat anti-phage system QueC-like protein QatC n=1 Tax=Bosea vestrisii TaxID=151416 RepID=UPI0024E00AE1|nr:Qat anti-phage system QueC-like protein QatC [Bosea vestrisii]WID95158.1 7-cyano-7-deazaguanine synthase [Bosea vestrisii]
MTRVICHAGPEDVPKSRFDRDVHVVLYGRGHMPDGVARLGAGVMDAVSRLGFALQSEAFDFLTIAMAVTAADTFILREEAEDRWSRGLELTIPLSNPGPWIAVRARLEEALRFLSGDAWSLEFRSEGPRRPLQSAIDRRRWRIDLTRSDSACLFSGGLDSYVGVLDLLAGGGRPALVSHSYRGDRRYQNLTAQALPVVCARFSANAHPTWTGNSEVSMRTRSFNFLAYGAAVGTAISQIRSGRRVDLWVPENGLIALNAPLTARRIGSHSTRTTHPHFLQSMQGIFDAVGLPVRIENPLRHQTKGEMLRRHATDPRFAAQAVRTVSCGKWKRDNTQCGRCVPCLIRRASFHAAGIADNTGYRCELLATVMADSGQRDDLASVRYAVRKAPTADIERWVLQAGPLPENAVERDGCIDVFGRGIEELRTFLHASGLP